MITTDEESLNEAYTAVTKVETREGKAALLRAFRPAILHGLADMTYQEWEGLRQETVINNILTEI